MSQRERNDYIKFRGLTKNFMTICGLWYYENSSFVYRMIPYGQITVCSAIALGMLKFIYEHRSNLSLVIKCSNVAISYMFVIFKVVCFIINREDLTNLQKVLDPYLDEMLKDSKISKLVLKNISSFKFLSRFLSGAIIFTTTFYVCMPLFMIFYFKHNNINVTHYPGLYPTSYLWEKPSKGLGYQAQYLFEFTAAYTLVAVTISMDTLFTLYIFQIVGRLRKISYYISLADDTNEKINTLSACVAQYEELIKYKDLLQRIYGPITLIMLTLNAVILCTVLFQLAHVSFTLSVKSIIQLFGFSMHVILKTSQTFLYSWSGSCLIKESEMCQYAAYTANWYGNQKLMSSIVIILSQRPLVLTACNFSIVNVRIFIMVLNTSLSYFFLLETIEEHN